MFNVLVSGDGSDWQSDQRMGMLSSRFLEYSGDESDLLSIKNPASLKALEGVTSFLMHEVGAGDPDGSVRVGQMRDIRVAEGMVTFRFTETGRIPRKIVEEGHTQLQMTGWELGRTHWAVKDGDAPQEVLRHLVPTPCQYDVVLSFAGEDRGYVEDVADFLLDHGVKVFYDKYEQATLWGKDLVENLDGIFRLQSRFCVMFISRHYAAKMWPTHERRAAFARGVQERDDYVLPARFDDSDIPGLRPTVVYQDLRTMGPEDLGKLILQKLGRR